MEDAYPWPEEIPVPQVVIDGGDEEWPLLGEVVTRRVEGMAPGDVLEVVSHNRRNRADIPAWCYLHGHDLVSMQAQGDTAWFWIRKGVASEGMVSEW